MNKRSDFNAVTFLIALRFVIFVNLYISIQFQKRLRDTTTELVSYFQHKIQTNIERKYIVIVRENEAKRKPETTQTTTTQYSGLFKAGGLAAGGAAVGAIVAGPAGSAIGGIFGAAIGYLIS